jgi:hypothetical protein
MLYSYSQIQQDVIVDGLLKNKENGFFLDVGAGWYDNLSNSCFFERNRAWKGIAIELAENDIYGKPYAIGWEMFRKNTIFLKEDATIINYNEILEKYNAPKIIDYLSLDLEPPEISLIALQNIMKSDYIFKVITYEVDFARQKATINPSRKLLAENNYILIKELIYNWDGNHPDNHVDDLWVHKSLYSHLILK